MKSQIIEILSAMSFAGITSGLPGDCQVICGVRPNCCGLPSYKIYHFSGIVGHCTDLNFEQRKAA